MSSIWFGRLEFHPRMEFLQSISPKEYKKKWTKELIEPGELEHELEVLNKSSKIMFHRPLQD